MEKFKSFSKDICDILKKIDSQEYLKGLYEEVEWNDMSIEEMNDISKDTRLVYNIDQFENSVDMGIYLDEQEKELNNMYEKIQENYSVNADIVDILYQNITESIIEETY